MPKSLFFYSFSMIFIDFRIRQNLKYQGIWGFAKSKGAKTLRLPLLFWHLRAKTWKIKEFEILGPQNVPKSLFFFSFSRFFKEFRKIKDPKRSQKTAKSEQKGAQREPKGAKGNQKKPKRSQNGAQKRPKYMKKSTFGKGREKGSQKAPTVHYFLTHFWTNTLQHDSVERYKCLRER